MSQILIFVLILIAIMAILIALGMYFHGNNEHNDDSAYRNENGDHIYYERSIIEKKEFIKNNPDSKDMRTFKALFKRNKKS